MPTLLQINITANWGSHGKIAEGIGKIAIANGWESYIAYGRWMNPSQSKLYHIGSDLDEAIHGISSRIFDNHGLMSHRATLKLIKFIDSIQPDIIHLHNIHGYYLNYPILCKYLAKRNKPVVWTLHDCWPYTGHCAHYMFAQCERWKKHCHSCPLKGNYPKSVLFDRSYQNYEDKQKAFLSIPNLTIVPVSKWLQTDLQASFLQNCNIEQIYNGIDTNIFHIHPDTDIIKKQLGIPTNNKVVLGVASNWYHKGLDDFIALNKALPQNYTIILVGLTQKEIKQLPTGIIGIERTENIDQLCKLYSLADVYFNPTWEDTFPTTNIEAMACGTPVITYNTGGSPEAVDEHTGYVITKGNINSVLLHIKTICQKENIYTQKCRQRVLAHFNQNERFAEYFCLYRELL